MKDRQIIALIIASHLTGLIGLYFQNTRELFLILTPYHLLFMFFLTMVSIRKINRNLLFYISAFIICSIILEVIGVRSGKIFGHYHYGDTLGFRIFQVPILIGFNWVLLILSSSILPRFFSSSSPFPLFWNIFLSALCMLLVDWVMEPVAVNFHYWVWEGGIIPWQNYLAWFLFSCLFQWIFQTFYPPTVFLQGKNRPLVVLYLSQLIFFLALNIIFSL